MRPTVTGDYQVWHALHAPCGDEGCGGCVVIDVDWSDEDWDALVTAAYWAGEPIDVFIHKAVVAGMKAEGY
jgi:hypothetical protein